MKRCFSLCIPLENGLVRTRVFGGLVGIENYNIISNQIDLTESQSAFKEAQLLEW